MCRYFVGIVRKSVNIRERQNLCINVPVHDNVGMFCPQSNFFLLSLILSNTYAICDYLFGRLID